MNDFEHWAAEFDPFELATFDANSIVLDSNDPIDCAKRLRERLLAEKASREDRIRLQRLGLQALGNKYNGPYIERIPLEVLINDGYALPEPDEKIRKRTSTTPRRFTGTTFLRGHFSLIGNESLEDTATGEKHSYITLRMRNAVVLNEFSQPIETHELPDYVITPVRSIIRYAFLYDQVADR